MKEQKALYVITNKQLNNSVYQCVQGAHAVAQYVMENPNSDWNNGYIVFVESSNIHLLIKRLELEADYSIFREPDLDNEITAVAAYLDRNNRITKNLRLVT